MVDTACVELQITVVGAKRKDADKLANPNKQAGHSPQEARACKVLAKGRRGRLVDKGGSNEEKPKIARGKNPVYGPMGE
jgi:hypothetical protein